MNTIDLQGRVALITGGSGGIGQAIALRVLRRGAAVCTWDASVASAVEGVTRMEVDITDENAVARAYSEVIAKFERVDILVNSAGITGPTVDVQAFSLEAWNRVLAINLTGTFLCCRAVVAGMLSNGYGRIVNIASIAGKEGNPQQSAYSASKAGVIALTKSLGKELASADIRVNCIAPAMIKSALLQQMPREKLDENLAKIPMGRPGTVEEVAALAAWLASSDCSFCTGAVLDASGGRATY